MTQCLDCPLPPVPDRLPFHPESFISGRNYWERPLGGFKQPFCQSVLGSLDPSRLPFTPGKVMPTEKDDVHVRHPTAAHPLAIVGLQGRWYERLNRDGPTDPSVPFIDGTRASGYSGNVLKSSLDDPPFYLQKPSSDEASVQFVQTENSSSRPGPGSQPPPLSHSLLSQLELGENDPNTFREVIDDLTVQNKKLKKRLRRYKRMNHSHLSHDGLLEIRVQKLSPQQKQKLEVILQQFVSSLTDDLPAKQREEEPPEDTRLKGKAPSISSTNIKPLDSTYASVSTTRGTIKQTAAAVENSTSQLLNRQELPASRFPRATSPADLEEEQSIGLNLDLDRSKQKLVVKRLEGLFLGEVDEAAVTETGSRSGSPNEGSRGSDGLDKPQASSSNDSLCYLRHLGLASPLDSSTPSSQNEWVYLNLLANMARLHTLNVTPDFVRRAIREGSARLVLSEDGAKLRWQGRLERSVVSPDNLSNNVSPSKVLQSTSTESALEGQCQQNPIANLAAFHSDKDRGSTRMDTSTTRPPHQMQARQRHYKPLFAHSRRRAIKLQQKSQDDSSDGSNSSSESEAVSMSPGAAPAGSKSSNGPLVFFKTEPYFLDLSADVAGPDAIVHPTYSTCTAEPVGRRSAVRRTSQDYEKKQDISFAAQPTTSDTFKKTSPAPLLHIYHGDPTCADDASEADRELYFEASGIGGIQLEDKFAIDVKTLHNSNTTVLHQGRTLYHRLLQTTARHAHPIQRTSPPQYQSHRILSVVTTHLPPSPLPPPSYVYPTLSSSGSESEDEYDSDTDSEYDLGFRQVSLSPQMRIFLEHQQPLDSPLRLSDNGRDISSEGDSDGSSDG